MIPADRIAIQLFTVRDAIRRRDDRTGIRGGFRGVFETLAAIGYRGVELAGYEQGENGPIEAREIGRLLDATGLVAVGAHVPLERWRVDPDHEIERAQRVGLTRVGTPDIPTTRETADDWQRAADELAGIGRRVAAAGLTFYQHNHHIEYAFVADRPGIRRLPYLMSLVDPDVVRFEMDIYWAFVARHRYRGYVDGRGNRQESVFDPIAQLASSPGRYPLWHVKDGVRTDTADGLAFAPVGSGSLPFDELVAAVPLPADGWAIVEQDDAPDPADPARSLRLASVSYAGIRAIRAPGG